VPDPCSHANQDLRAGVGGVSNPLFAFLSSTPVALANACLSSPIPLSPIGGRRKCAQPVHCPAWGPPLQAQGVDADRWMRACGCSVWMGICQGGTA